MADWKRETSKEGRSRGDSTRTFGAAERMIRVTIGATAGAALRSSGTGTIVGREVGSSTALSLPRSG